VRIYAYYRFVVMPNVKKHGLKLAKEIPTWNAINHRVWWYADLFFPTLNIFTFYVQMVTRAIETLTLFVAERFTSLSKTARRVDAAN